MSDIPKIPGYKIVKMLGEGGMASVFLGIEKKFDRKIAIKVLEPSLLKNKTSASRFKREAKTAASFSHTNVVRIFDIDQVDKYHYIVMEYLEESLRDRINFHPQGKMPPEIALGIVKKVIGALDFAHFRGVYHRDIKPENIMFRHDSTPVLVDFGIARIFDSTERLTKSGSPMGTVAYMSPEQCKGRKVDGRSDIYSLGVVLFEMLTGDIPYKGESHISVALQHIEDPVPRLPQEVNQYQPLIDQMMAKKKTERLSGGVHFLHMLEEIMPESPAPISPPLESDTSRQKIAPPHTKDKIFEFIKKYLISFKKYLFSFEKYLNSLKERVSSFREYAREKRKTLMIGVPVSVLVLAVILITFISQSKGSKNQTTPGQETHQSQGELRLAQQYLEKAESILRERKKIKPAPEVTALEKKIRQAKDKTYDEYLADARTYFGQRNFPKAGENILCAKQIKTTPELVTLENSIEEEYTKEQNRLKKLEKEKQDDQAYEQAISKNTIDGYRKYLVKFPKGRHIIEVTKRFKKLRVALLIKQSRKLRAEFKTLESHEVNFMIEKHDFFDKILNETGSFQSYYEEKTKNGDPIIIDHTTRLMWHNRNHSEKQTLKETEKWLKFLNRYKYAGYNDWRLPTAEEAASLLRKDKNEKGMYIESIFAGNQEIIWTGDRFRAKSSWVVFLCAGFVELSENNQKNQGLAVRSLERRTP